MNPFWLCWWLESNLVQFVEKAVWGEIISITVWGNVLGFFFFAFWWNLCHVNTMMFFLLLFPLSLFFCCFFYLLFSYWLTTLWISAHPNPGPPLHLQSYQKPPNLPNEILSCLFLWEAMAQNWHFHPFLYMAKKKKKDKKKKAIVPSLSVRRITIPMLYWMYYGLLNKGKTFRFLTIQILIMECAWKIQKKNRKKKQNNKKGRAFLGPVLSWLLNRWMNSVEGVLCVFWNGSFSYYACLTALIRQPSK